MPLRRIACQLTRGAARPSSRPWRRAALAVLAALALLPTVETRAPAQHVSLWPLFVLHRDEKQIEVEVLWPAFHLDRAPDKSHLHLLWPLTGFIREGEQRHRWIFPLLFWGRTAPDRRYGVLFPLAGMLPDRGIHWFANVIRIEEGEDRVWAVLPFYFQRGPDTWGLGLPPLFLRTQSGAIDQITLFPLGWWSDPQRWGLFPFLWRDGDWWASFPLIGWHTQSRGDWFFLFPLRLHTVDLDIETEHVLWPFFALGAEAYGLRWRLWPLVGHRSHRWAHGNIPRRRTTYLLWPLLWHHREWNSRGELLASADVAAPLCFHFGRRRGGGYPTTTLLPPLLTGWARTSLGRLRALTVLFPLYLQTWSDTGDATTWRVLWEGAAGHHGAEEHTFRVLWRLFRHTRRGPESRVELFPVIVWERDTARDSVALSFLWRLVAYSRTGHQRRLRLLFLPWQIPLSHGPSSSGP